MSSRYEVPELLRSLFIRPSADDLTLITSTLSCTADWLISRLTGHYVVEQGGILTAVVLASCTRDRRSWRASIRRSTGIDIDTSRTADRFAFVDCFPSLLDSAQRQTPLTQLELDIKHAISSLRSRHAEARIFMVVDSPEVLIATGHTTSVELSRTMLHLRRHVYATTLSVTHDWPPAAKLGGDAGRAAALEAECMAFVVGQSHLSKTIVSTNQLETGAAKDVSGLLRQTRAGCAYDWAMDGLSDPVAESEFLYLVNRDGTTSVFSKGARA